MLIYCNVEWRIFNLRHVERVWRVTEKVSEAPQNVVELFLTLLSHTQVYLNFVLLVLLTNAHFHAMSSLSLSFLQNKKKSKKNRISILDRPIFGRPANLCDVDSWAARVRPSCKKVQIRFFIRKLFNYKWLVYFP